MVRHSPNRSICFLGREASERGWVKSAWGRQDAITAQTAVNQPKRRTRHTTHHLVFTTSFEYPYRMLEHRLLLVGSLLPANDWRLDQVADREAINMTDTGSSWKKVPISGKMVRAL
jgi:hypothetical protein